MTMKDITGSPKASRREVMLKYREGRRRIDFYPTPQVTEWIDRLMAENPSMSANFLVNDLIRFGVEHLSPEAARKTWPD